MYFFCVKGQTRNMKTFQWPLTELREIYRRMFLMRNSAMEMFLADKTSILLNFPMEETPKALAKIMGLRPPYLLNFASIEALLISFPIGIFAATQKFQ